MSSPKTIFGYLRANNLLYELANKCSIVGRDKQCDIVINSTSVSNRHAVIEFVEEEQSGSKEKENSQQQEKEKYVCILKDLFSTNGTVVNGMPLPSGGKTYLRNGDTVNFAFDETIYKVELNQSLVKDAYFDESCEFKVKKGNLKTLRQELLESIEVLSRNLKQKIQQLSYLPPESVEKDEATENLPRLENIQNTLEEVSDTLKTKLSPENMDPFKLEKDTYIRVLEKRVNELRNKCWDQEEEIEQLKKLLKTKDERQELFESLSRINKTLQNDLNEKEMEIHRLKSENQSLQIKQKDYNNTLKRLETYIQQNNELKISHEQLRRQLLSSQNYCNYLHNELIKNKLTPLTSTQFNSQSDVPTPRLSPTVKNKTKYLSDRMFENERLIQQLERENDILCNQLKNTSNVEVCQQD
jgi:chromosome segregation ATPase